MSATVNQSQLEGDPRHTSAWPLTYWVWPPTSEGWFESDMVAWEDGFLVGIGECFVVYLQCTTINSKCKCAEL